VSQNGAITVREREGGEEMIVSQKLMKLQNKTEQTSNEKITFVNSGSSQQEQKKKKLMMRVTYKSLFLNIRHQMKSDILAISKNFPSNFAR
jgi:hypothetical protein